MAIPDMNARKLQLPWDDAGILGDIDGYLKIPRDIALTAAWLFGIGPDKTHVLQTDVNGNLKVTTSPQAGTITASKLVDVNGNALSTTNPLVVGSYPVLLASQVNQTITATTVSPSFDARPYQNIYIVSVVTAISGAGATVQAFLDIQEPISNTWWTINNDIGINAVSGTAADGALQPTKKQLVGAGVAALEVRPTWPNARISWLVTGTTPSITFSSYVWGF